MASEHFPSSEQEKIKAAFEDAIRRGDFALFQSLTSQHGLNCLESDVVGDNVMGATAKALLALLQNAACDNESKQKILDSILEADVLTENEKYILFSEWFIKGEKWQVIKLDDDGGVAPEEKEDDSAKAGERVCALTLFRHCSLESKASIVNLMLEEYYADPSVPPEFICVLMREIGQRKFTQVHAPSFLMTGLFARKQWRAAGKLLALETWEKLPVGVFRAIGTTSDRIALVYALEHHAPTKCNFLKADLIGYLQRDEMIDLVRAMGYGPFEGVLVKVLWEQLNNATYEDRALRLISDLSDVLSGEQRTCFNRHMIERAISLGRCDIVITLLSAHRPLLVRASLLKMLGEQEDALQQKDSALVKGLATRMDLAVQGDVNGNSLIRIFLLFKLGQGVLKNDLSIMQDLQKELRRVLAVAVGKVQPQLTSPLSPEHRQLMRVLFEIGKEGRYIGDGGQLEGEPVIDGKTFLQWTADRNSGLMQELFLAGADTTGLEDHAHVREFIACHSNFDRFDEPEFDEKYEPKTTTVVGTLLHVMPRVASELVARYSQPLLAHGQLGVQRAEIDASCGRLRDYANVKWEHCDHKKQLNDEMQKKLDQKAESGEAVTQEETLALQASLASHKREMDDVVVLVNISAPSTLGEILEKTEAYLEAHKNEDVDPELKALLNELLSYTKHLRYGEVSKESKQDNDNAPRQRSGAEFFAQPVDMPDGGPAVLNVDTPSVPAIPASVIHGLGDP